MGWADENGNYSQDRAEEEPHYFGECDDLVEEMREKKKIKKMNDVDGVVDA